MHALGRREDSKRKHGRGEIRIQRAKERAREIKEHPKT